MPTGPFRVGEIRCDYNSAQVWDDGGTGTHRERSVYVKSDRLMMGNADEVAQRVADVLNRGDFVLVRKLDA